jgi:hypothetical protein
LSGDGTAAPVFAAHTQSASDCSGWRGGGGVRQPTSSPTTNTLCRHSNIHRRGISTITQSFQIQTIACQSKSQADSADRVIFKCSGFTLARTTPSRLILILFFHIVIGIEIIIIHCLIVIIVIILIRSALVNRAVVAVGALHAH